MDEATERVADGVLGTLREGCRDGVGSVKARASNIARCADNPAHGLEESREYTSVATATVAAVLATVLATVLAAVLAVGSAC